MIRHEAMSSAGRLDRLMAPLDQVISEDAKFIIPVRAFPLRWNRNTLYIPLHGRVLLSANRFHFAGKRFRCDNHRPYSTGAPDSIPLGHSGARIARTRNPELRSRRAVLRLPYGQPPKTGPSISA
jgi:hypothetical protein